MGQNIYLIGFMGVGKSTVSKWLKQLTGLKEIDTDAEIVRREGRSINDIFASEGEAYFRRAETELMQNLAKSTDCIISCGGGVVLREENVTAMHAGGEVVYLRAKPDIVYEHVKNDHSRPILDGHMNVEYIAELMRKREPWYEAAQTFTVDTDGKSIEQVAREIMRQFGLEPVMQDI